MWLDQRGQGSKTLEQVVWKFKRKTRAWPFEKQGAGSKEQV